MKKSILNIRVLIISLVMVKTVSGLEIREESYEIPVPSLSQLYEPFMPEQPYFLSLDDSFLIEQQPIVKDQNKNTHGSSDQSNKRLAKKASTKYHSKTAYLSWADLQQRRRHQNCEAQKRMRGKTQEKKDAQKALFNDVTQKNYELREELQLLTECRNELIQRVGQLPEFAQKLLGVSNVLPATSNTSAIRAGFIFSSVYDKASDTNETLLFENQTDEGNDLTFELSETELNDFVPKSKKPIKYLTPEQQEAKRASNRRASKKFRDKKRANRALSAVQEEQKINLEIQNKAHASVDAFLRGCMNVTQIIDKSS